MNQLLAKRPSERRASPRLQPAFGTICRLGAADARRPVGLVWDLSATGLSLLTAAPPDEGQVVLAELAAECGPARLAVPVRVVHVRAVSTGDFFVGARFEHQVGASDLAPFVTPEPGRPLPRAG